MDRTGSDPLGELFAETAQVNREVLAAALREIIWLDRDSLSIHFKHGVREQLGRTKSIIAALLGQKALTLTAPNAEDGITPR